MTTFTTAPASQKGALLRLPLEVRRKIYSFIFHGNPRPFLERPGGPTGNRLNVKTEPSQSTRPKFVTHVEGVTCRACPACVGKVDINLRLTPVIRTCQKCYEESKHLFYESIYLGFHDAELVLPFFVRNIRPYLTDIKRVDIDLHGERLGYIDPTISWTAVTPNLKSFVLEVCEKHEWGERDFDTYTSNEKTRRARKWLESFPHFVQECKASRSFQILVNIRSFNLDDDIEPGEDDDTEEYLRTCGDLSFDVNYILDNTEPQQPFTEAELAAMYPKIV